jgi:quercetin dioxygenase-like cupin family protein
MPDVRVLGMAHTGQTVDNPVSGERIVFQRTAATTGGQLLAFELFLSPNGHVPASHVHPQQEERFTVVAGRMRFRRGMRTLIAGPGETIVVPPRTIHRFANAGLGEARVHVEVRPALRMEELLETSAALAREGRTFPNGLPLPLELALFLREFERELRIPLVPHSVVQAALVPVARLAERRGLGVRYEHRRLVA